MTLLLNADTFQMANRLVRDEALRKVVAQDAEQLATLSINTSAAGAPASKTGSPLPSSSPAPAPAAAKSSGTGNASDPLDQLNIPLRWTTNDWDALAGLVNVEQPQRFFNGLYKLLGLAITALVLTMGAEFWYNVLKRLVPTIPGKKADVPSRT